MRKKKLIRESVPEWRQGIRNSVNWFLAENGFYVGTMEPARTIKRLDKYQRTQIKFERWKRKNFGKDL